MHTVGQAIGGDECHLHVLALPSPPHSHLDVACRGGIDLLLARTDGGAVEVVGYACLGCELKGGNWSPCGHKGIAYAMTEIGGIGEGVGHSALIGVEATVVAVGMEILSPGI